MKFLKKDAVWWDILELGDLCLGSLVEECKDFSW